MAGAVIVLPGPVDFLKNEARQLRAELLSSDPAGAGLFEGRVWLNTTSNVLKYSPADGQIAEVGSIDWGEVEDISSIDWGDAAAAGSTGEVADAGHQHAAPANPVTAHEAAGDPHTQYTTTAEAQALVDTHVNDTTDAHDASAISIADAAGDFTADNVEDALAELQSDNEAHVAAADPHTGYLKESDVNAKGDIYVATANDTVTRKGVGTDGHFLAADSAQADGLVYRALVDGDIPAGIARDAEVTSAISTHAGAADPHTVYQLESEKGQANGYASLDGAGRVPNSQLPVSAMEYKGTWNANTNSPTLADGTGSTGDLYRVSTAGTQDLGSGNITFDIGDYVIYNGTTWEKGDTTDAVSSVFSRTGAVTAQVDDYASFYPRAMSAQIGNGTDTEFTITHNLNTRRVKPVVREVASPYSEYPLVGNEALTVNTVKLYFSGIVPSTNQFEVTVIGF